MGHVYNGCIFLPADCKLSHNLKNESLILMCNCHNIQAWQVNGLNKNYYHEEGSESLARIIMCSSTVINWMSETPTVLPTSLSVNTEGTRGEFVVDSRGDLTKFRRLPGTNSRAEPQFYESVLRHPLIGADLNLFNSFCSVHIAQSHLSAMSML